jgi:hypothetical protein
MKQTVVLAHMLGYLTEVQMKDARNQGLQNDNMHLLGYLDSPHWKEAFGMFKGQDLVELRKLAKLVDLNYNTDFASEENITQRDLLIEKYTQLLANVKENQTKEEEGRAGGLTDLERREYESLIRVYAETIRDLKALPNL